MVVTLAERSAVDRGPRGGVERTHLMEKFVIDGGVPLSGTIVPAGNLQ